MRSEEKRNRLSSAVVALIILSSVAVWPALARTTPNATIQVTNINDSGPGSLRDAIASATSGDTITFSLGTYPATITLSSTLSIGTSLTISGPGASNLAISGNSLVQVFQIASGTIAAIYGLTIQNGRGSGGAIDGTVGGGVYNFGTLAISDSNVSESYADRFGGGIYNGGTLTLANSTVSGNWLYNGGIGGGVYNFGTLTINNSTISGNNASFGVAGGIFNAPNGTLTITNSTVSSNYGDVGAGIRNDGTLTVSNSNISGNLADMVGGGIENAGTLNMTNSTISGNNAHGLGHPGGGGIYNGGTLMITDSTISGNSSGNSSGGGIFSYGGALTLINSTVSNNRAYFRGGGISGSATLINSTVSGNRVSNGGGAAAGISGGGALKNTILANNTADAAGFSGNCDSSFSWSSYGHNLSDDNSCSDFFSPALGDLNNTPAGLDPGGLKDNGGPTQTIALLPPSPAVDAIPLSSCAGVDGTPIATDQRGLPRSQSSGCDVGAFQHLPITGPAPASEMTCNGVYNGTFNGDLTVSAGQNCIFFNGGVTGNVQQYGGNFVLFQSQVGGAVNVTGDGTFSIGTGSTINGSLQVQNLPSGSVQNQVCGTHVSGNLQVQNNGTAVLIGANPPSGCTGNTVGGNLQVQNNFASTSVVGNSIGGNLMNENNTAPTEVFNNTVSGNLHCQNDTTIQGGGNTVGNHRQEQCSGF